MDKREIIGSFDINEFLDDAIKNNIVGVMSYNSKGKWCTSKICICEIKNSSFNIKIDHEDAKSLSNPRSGQPVGMSFQVDYYKYIFETKMTDVNITSSAKDAYIITLDHADRIERMKRRVYERVKVPSDLNIKVLFWHRGYLNESVEPKQENYWQGKLLNISAGGMQLCSNLNKEIKFLVGQHLGLQFTPLFYEKPILLESQIMYLKEDTNNSVIYIGVEFLGLEASNEGREKLHRLVTIVDDYRMKSDSKYNKGMDDIKETEKEESSDLSNKIYEQADIAY